MERRKAIIASAGLAGVVVLGAIGFAANGALGSSAPDGVGKLQPAVPTVTVVIDPATGIATPAPAAASAPTAGAAA